MGLVSDATLARVLAVLRDGAGHTREDLAVRLDLHRASVGRACMMLSSRGEIHLDESWHPARWFLGPVLKDDTAAIRLRELQKAQTEAQAAMESTRTVFRHWQDVALFGAYVPAVACLAGADFAANDGGLTA